MLSELVLFSCLTFFMVQSSYGIKVTEAEFDSWNATPLCTTDQGALAVCNQNYADVDASKTGCQDESLALVGANGKHELKTRTVVSCGFSDADNIVITKSGSSQKLIWMCDDDGVFFPNSAICSTDDQASTICNQHYGALDSTECKEVSLGLQDGRYCVEGKNSSMV